MALSTFMSVISGILVLGTTAEMYLYGTQLWMDSVGRAFTYALSAHLFVPMMFHLKLTSVFTVSDVTEFYAYASVNMSFMHMFLVPSSALFIRRLASALCCHVHANRGKIVVSGSNLAAGFGKNFM